VSFVHESGQEFADLLEIVAAERGLRRSIVEKDDWVTHALWALSVGGFEVWFKGGTSKGFGLIERFSEDLDLKVEPGGVTALPAVLNWKSDGAKATAERRAYFEALSRAFTVPGCRVALDVASIDKAWRGASLRVAYPSVYPGELPPEGSDHILLEVGSARVTLLEKLDALHRRFPNEKAAPQTFVRHYEDAARLALGAGTLPPLEGYADVRALADEMLAQRQLVGMPSADDVALLPRDDERWKAIRSAHAAIEPMFWGPRVSIDDASDAIRGWVARELG
jgi:hypothetical protein